VTDRARVASLPDETPVEDLPLLRFTINRLREGGIMTLGQLRAMPNRDLLRLRRFGLHSLADVWALARLWPFAEESLCKARV
jgi:DNA-directed RNA polymerase alpha subunit